MTAATAAAAAIPMRQIVVMAAAGAAASGIATSAATSAATAAATRAKRTRTRAAKSGVAKAAAASTSGARCVVCALGVAGGGVLKIVWRSACHTAGCSCQHPLLMPCTCLLAHNLPPTSQGERSASDSRRRQLEARLSDLLGVTASGGPSLEVLRAERLAREAGERARQEALMGRWAGVMGCGSRGVAVVISQAAACMRGATARRVTAALSLPWQVAPLHSSQRTACPPHPLPDPLITSLCPHRVPAGASSSRATTQVTALPRRWQRSATQTGRPPVAKQRRGPPSPTAVAGAAPADTGGVHFYNMRSNGCQCAAAPLGGGMATAGASVKVPDTHGHRWVVGRALGARLHPHLLL